MVEQKQKLWPRPRKEGRKISSWIIFRLETRQISEDSDLGKDSLAVDDAAGSRTSAIRKPEITFLSVSVMDIIIWWCVLRAKYVLASRGQKTDDMVFQSVNASTKNKRGTNNSMRVFWFPLNSWILDRSIADNNWTLMQVLNLAANYHTSTDSQLTNDERSFVGNICDPLLR